MKKNTFKKNFTLPCLGIGMMLALNACGTASQSASAETLTSSSTTVGGGGTPRGGMLFSFALLRPDVGVDGNLALWCGSSG